MTITLWERVKLGSKVGFVLSTIYAVIGMFILILPSYSGSGWEIIPLTILSTVIIFFYAVLPSTLVGLLTGIIIGQIVKMDNIKEVQTTTFTIISMAVCCLLALSIHIIFQIEVSWSFEQFINLGGIFTYPYLFGIPTIIYILAGGWFGNKVHSKFINS